jgi:hypothetical protein
MEVGKSLSKWVRNSVGDLPTKLRTYLLSDVLTYQITDWVSYPLT